MSAEAKQLEDNVLQWATFRLEDETYGVDVMQVQEQELGDPPAGQVRIDFDGFLEIPLRLAVVPPRLPQGPEQLLYGGVVGVGGGGSGRRMPSSVKVSENRCRASQAPKRCITW